MVKPLLFLLCLLLTLAGAAPARAQDGHFAPRPCIRGSSGASCCTRRSARETPGPRPLVIVLHGSGQPPQELRDWLPMDPIADREGFVVAYPDAIGGRWNYGERPDEKVDDLGFIDALLDAWWRAASPTRRGSTSPASREAR